MGQIAMSVLSGMFWGGVGAAAFLGIGAALGAGTCVASWSAAVYWIATLGSGFLVGFAEAAWNEYMAGGGLTDICIAGLEGGFWGVLISAGVGAVFRNAPAFFKWLGLGCFVAGTPVVLPTLAGSVTEGTKSGQLLRTAAIETLRLGDKVQAVSISNSESTTLGTPDNSWRTLTLEFVSSDGEQMQMQLLRPPWWMSQQQITTVGAQGMWRIDELDFEGTITLLAITDPPEIQHGDGNLITGLFSKQSSAPLCAVYLRGIAEPLVGTGIHKVWSPEKAGFVEIQNLHPGEFVSSAQGTHVVDRVEVSPPQPVFNIEVDGAHTYFAGSGQVLVHNADYTPTIGSAVSGPIRRLGENLAKMAKSMYGVLEDAGVPSDEIRYFTGMIVEMLDGTRKVFINSSASKKCVDAVKEWAKGNKINPNDVIQGVAGDHAEEAFKKAVQPGQYKAYGVGNRACDRKGASSTNHHCYDKLEQDGYINGWFWGIWK